MTQSESNSSDKPLHHSLWLKFFFLWSCALSMDFFGGFENSILKQFPALAALMMIGIRALSDQKIVVPSFPVRGLMILMGMAIPGLIYNKMQHLPSSLMTAVVLMLVVVSTVAVPVQSLKFSGDTLLKLFPVLGGLFVFSSALGLAFKGRFWNPVHFSVHERAFLFPLAFLPFWIMGKRKAAVIGFLATCLVIALDFRSTSALVIGVSLLSAFALSNWTQPRWRRKVYWTCGGMILLAGLFFPFILHLHDQLKQRLLQASNIDFRVDLLLEAKSEFLDSPIWGSAFVGGTHYQVIHRFIHSFEMAPPAPLHNDYLEFLTKGGLIGLGLFLTGLLGTVYLSLKLLEDRDLPQNERRLGVLLLSVLLSALVTIALNPVLNQSRGFLVYFLVALLILLERSRRQRKSGEPFFDLKYCFFRRHSTEARNG